MACNNNNNNDDQIAYKIQNSTDKDKGLFANRPIRRGELIISEKPLFTLNKYGYVSVQNTINELEKKVEKLSKSDQDSFNSLHNSWPMIPSKSLATFKTNALPLGHDSPIGAIFPTISRINHSCLPNVNHYWNETKKVETIYALKDISINEEILTSYIEIYNDKKTRQDLLQEGFNFVCKCELCSIQDIKVQKCSDIRRNLLRTLDEEIPELGAYNPAKALEKIYLMEKLIKEEGIEYDANRMGKI